MIISGSVAERMPIISRVILSSAMVFWVYPIVVHWCWNPNGWLHNIGYIDLAGCGPIHVI
jgi:Amt family ammonium transporter